MTLMERDPASPGLLRIACRSITLVPRERASLGGTDSGPRAVSNRVLSPILTGRHASRRRAGRIVIPVHPAAGSTISRLLLIRPPHSFPPRLSRGYPSRGRLFPRR
ncbi:hypothetical protein BV20DRAFT_657849 [Pilatotrama ljubarskyi]|nr:hypothetical protein BV20DRAFT_657849 [Pilatotrama ljubarskyi]